MINYITGDLFAHLEAQKPIRRNYVIPHIVNNIGKWASGFVVPVERDYPLAARAYRDWHYYDGDPERNMPFSLGNTQIVKVADGTIPRTGIYVANMIAQNGIIGGTNRQPLNYESLEKCLERVGDAVHLLQRSGPCEILAPRFGSLRAGGDWDTIEKMIEASWKIFDVTIFRFDETK